TFEGNDVTHGAPGVDRFLFARDDYRQVSQEVRLASQYDGNLQWLIGGYWHAGEIDFETGDSDRRNARNPQFIRTAATQNETIISAFAKVDWEFNPAWLVEAGLRWTRVEKTFSGIDERIRNQNVAPDQRALFAQTLTNDVSGNPAAFSEFGRQIRNEFVGEERNFSDVLPSVAITFQPNDRISTYYRWSEGYKAGGFNFRLNGLDDTTLDFDAETVSAHELGLKIDWYERNLTLAAVLFVSDYDGLQQNSNRGDDGVISAAVIRNAAAASSDGIEIELAWQPIETLGLNWSATFLDAQYDDFQGADCTRFQSVVSRTDVAALFGAERLNNRCSQDLSGGRLAHAPEFSQRAALTYSPAISDRFNVDGTFEWFYSDGFFTSPQADPLRRQSSFHKINARLSFAPVSGRWAIDVIATNLTNELTARQLGQDEDAAVSGLVDDPRRVGVRLRYNF
ncbi:MAG: TonB-dependent receptor, partial [Pseudomonadota bacterium]